MSYILDALKRADAERERGAVPGLHSQSLATPVALTPPGHRNALWGALAALTGIGALAAGTWLWSMPASQAPQVVEPARVAAPVSMPVTTASAAVAVITPLPIVVAVAPPLVKSPVIAPNVATTTATAKTPAPAPVNIPLLSELPEEFRRQIPALTITGAVYSETPANRLLLLNNLVLTQGSLAAPEVTLEDIRPKSSVFNFKGTRFRLAH
jgi:general secretion pathway protein B